MKQYRPGQVHLFSHPRLSDQENSLRTRRIVLLVLSIGLLIALVLSRLDPCIMIEGATYRSYREVDNFFGGMMHPEVSFHNGEFSWVITDMVIIGTYECKPGRIIAYRSYDGAPMKVQIYPGSGVLLWERDLYVKVSR